MTSHNREESVADQNQWVVVTIPSCPFCSLVKLRLKQAGIAFAERPISPEDRKNFKQLHGVSTFPQVFRGDVRIGGCNETVALLASM